MSIAPLLKVAKSLAPNLLLKGLTKINPKFKNFFTEAATYGYSANQALEYLTERFSPASSFENQLEKREAQGMIRPDEASAKAQISNRQIPGKALRSAISYGGAGLLGAMGQEEQPEEQAEQKQPNSQAQPQQASSQPQTAAQPQQAPPTNEELQGFIAKHPELGNYLDQLILKGGLSAREAVLMAKKKKKFSNAIENIESNIGQSLEDILEQFFSKPNQGQTAQKAQKPTLVSLLGKAMGEYNQRKSRK